MMMVMMLEWVKRLHHRRGSRRVVILIADAAATFRLFLSSATFLAVVGVDGRERRVRSARTGRASAGWSVLTLDGRRCGESLWRRAGRIIGSRHALQNLPGGDRGNGRWRCGILGTRRGICRIVDSLFGLLGAGKVVASRVIGSQRRRGQRILVRLSGCCPQRPLLRSCLVLFSPTNTTKGNTAKAMLLFHTRSGGSGKRWAFLHARAVGCSVMVRSSNKGRTLLENRGRNRWRHGVLASIGGQRFVIGIGMRNHRKYADMRDLHRSKNCKTNWRRGPGKGQAGCVRDGRPFADELMANDSPLTLRATTIDECR